MKRENTRKGFTLMEMLIVVAIIAVLVAIAIPVVSTSLSRARETTCTANRRSALALVTYTAMMDDAFRSDLADGMDWDAVNARLAQTEQPPFTEHICPDNGTIKLIVQENGAYSFSCSVHTETAPEDISGGSDDLDPIFPGIKIWAPSVGETYTVRHIYKYKGEYYRCLETHEYRVGAGMEPSASSTYWDKLFD